MTQRATTALSLHYHVKPGQREAILVEIQGPKPYRKAYMENVKQLLEKVEVEWNSPILEWGTNLTGLNQS
jgi:hypothetical protein